MRAAEPDSATPLAPSRAAQWLAIAGVALLGVASVAVTLEWFGVPSRLPATGVYARHVAGLTLHDVTVKVSGSDPRPKFFTDDVTGLDVNPPIL